MPIIKLLSRTSACAVLLCLILGPVSGVRPVSATPCFAIGSGTAGDPYQIWTNAELSCLESASSYSPASGVFYEQMDDIVRTSNTPLNKPHQISYDGNNHTITIRNVSNFVGLFGDTANATVSNLVVEADNSTAADYAGWLAGDDNGSTFTKVVVNAPISIYGGGIVGFGVDGTTISSSTSTGAIDDYGGGLVGAMSANVTINNSFSTGSIGMYGGGLVGSGAEDFSITSSFSTGSISNYGGGIAGSDSEGGVVSNSYSTGNIGAYGGGVLRPSPMSASAGIVTNSYSTGLLGTASDEIAETGFSGAIVTNSFGAVGTWSDSAANSSLTGVPTGSGSLGTTWGSCGANLPYFIASFYSSNPCVSALAEEVEVSGTDPTLTLSRTSITEPASDSFSLTSRVTSSPFSYVSLVNGSGSVSQGGTSCVQVSDCQIRDVTQGPYSRGTFTIAGYGTVSVRRFNSLTGKSTTVGTLSLVRVRPPTAATAVQSVTLTLNSNGGLCGASSTTVASGSSVALPAEQVCKKSGFRFLGWSDESGAAISVRELVLTSDRTLSARWTETAIPKATVSQGRIVVRISRLASDARVVRVRGRIVAGSKISDLQVWFKEKGMKSFVKSSSPIVRNGRQYTWFHHTGNSMRVYVMASGAERSKTLRISGQVDAG